MSLLEPLFDPFFCRKVVPFFRFLGPLKSAHFESKPEFPVNCARVGKNVKISRKKNSWKRFRLFVIFWTISNRFFYHFLSLSETPFLNFSSLKTIVLTKNDQKRCQKKVQKVVIFGCKKVPKNGTQRGKNGQKRGQKWPFFDKNVWPFLLLSKGFCVFQKNHVFENRFFQKWHFCDFLIKKMSKKWQKFVIFGI